MPPSSNPTVPGSILAQKYRVERVLGKGGMGVVVQARHIALDERVALKFLLPEYAQHPDASARFLREARAAVKIKSEHVARVSDVGTLETGAPYMVMEFLEGADLSNILQQKGVLGIEDAVDYILQACEAIGEAHSYGIVHRDIKPANLFLGKRPNGTPMSRCSTSGFPRWPRPASTTSRRRPRPWARRFTCRRSRCSKPGASTIARTSTPSGFRSTSSLRGDSPSWPIPYPSFASRFRGHAHADSGGAARRARSPGPRPRDLLREGPGLSLSHGARPRRRTGTVCAGAIPGLGREHLQTWRTGCAPGGASVVPERNPDRGPSGGISAPGAGDCPVAATDGLVSPRRKPGGTDHGEWHGPTCRRTNPPGGIPAGRSGRSLGWLAPAVAMTAIAVIGGGAWRILHRPLSAQIPPAVTTIAQAGQGHSPDGAEAKAVLVGTAIPPARTVVAVPTSTSMAMAPAASAADPSAAPPTSAAATTPPTAERRTGAVVTPRVGRQPPPRREMPPIYVPVARPAQPNDGIGF